MIGALEKARSRTDSRPPEPALRAKLSVFRAGAAVVRHVELSLAPGGALAVMGRNGAGKTTLLHGLFGLLPVRGEIALFGDDITARPTYARATAGMALVPQGRRLVPELTVAENLRCAELNRRGGGPRFDVHELFPALGELAGRRAGLLSGGEQQQVAIARALLRRPRILVLDEPTEGLAPRLIEQVISTLRTLREGGLTLLLAEQHLRVVAELCPEALVLRAGEAAAFGSTDSIEIKQQLESF